MRPQYNRRVQRALATLGVMVLAGGVSGAVASASQTTVRATAVKRHPHARPAPRAPRAPHSAARAPARA